jgi:hypothetical protein
MPNKSRDADAGGPHREISGRDCTRRLCADRADFSGGVTSPDITHHPGALPQGDARSRPAFYRDPVDRFSDQEVVGPGKAIGSPHTLFEPLMNRPEPLSAILSSIGRQDCFGLYRGGHSQ